MMGPIEWLETTAPNYQYTVRDIPAERSHLYLGGSLKSRTAQREWVHWRLRTTGFLEKIWSSRRGQKKFEGWYVENPKKKYNTILTIGRV
jgi:hypothetical protein